LPQSASLLRNDSLECYVLWDDRRGEDQRYQFKSDMQYTLNARVPAVLKWGVHVSEWVNTAYRWLGESHPRESDPHHGLQLELSASTRADRRHVRWFTR
jgi:hypothetical protein